MQLLFLLMLCVSKTLFCLEQSPLNLPAGITCRIHLTPHKDIQHYSLFTYYKILTCIETPYLWVHKITIRTGSYILEPTYGGSNGIQEIGPERAKLLFNQLKEVYQLAQEPSLYSLFANEQP